jgi:hypothetical protein
MFNTEHKSGYHSILGKKTDYNYEELEASLKYCEEFLVYFEEYKQNNNFFKEFDELQTKEKMHFLILLFFIVIYK